jgi:hypothetical protein
MASHAEASGSMNFEGPERLREFERENTRLKQLLAEA